MAEPTGESGTSGVDYGWILQVTFVLSIVLGVPVVAGLSAFSSLPTWEARAGFAVRVGATVWLVIGICVYAYARWISDNR
ncbi:MAG: DUF5822 domain-containing protein [Halodesulfurarchaeum sp.]